MISLLISDRGFGRFRVVCIRGSNGMWVRSPSVGEGFGNRQTREEGKDRGGGDRGRTRGPSLGAGDVTSIELFGSEERSDQRSSLKREGE